MAFVGLSVVCWSLLSAVGEESPDACWSQFRGPSGSGIAAGDATYPVEFGGGQRLLWKTAVPPGHSSPCVFEQRIFLTAATEEQLETLCLDRNSGAVLWRRTLAHAQAEKVHEVNSLATPTPTTDGERVYVYFGSYGLICYDFEGERVWERPLPMPDNMFGTAASPVVAGDLLLFCSDNRENSYLEAIEAATGETRWRRDRPGFGSGWSSPLVWRRGEVDEVVIYGVWWLTGYDLLDGSERWSVPGLTDEPCITPVQGEGMIYVTSYNMKTNPEVIGLPPFAAILEECDVDGSGTLSREETSINKSVLSRADADGEGDHPLQIFFRFLDVNQDQQIAADEWPKLVDWVDSFAHANGLLAIRPGQPGAPAEVVWQERRGVPECPSPLYYRGRVYLVKNGGIVSCLDAQTGEQKFFARLEAGGPYYASPVAAGGRIYAASARGTITVFGAGDVLEVQAHNELNERLMATPALVDGKIYVRSTEHLFAFGEPAEER